MLSLVVAGTALVAAANTPIYLRCTFEPNSTAVLITADEANSAVTISVPSTGHTEKLPAAFSATDLRFQNRQLSYVVSRTDLSVSRTIKLIKETDTGRCAIEQAPKRAF